MGIQYRLERPFVALFMLAGLAVSGFAQSQTAPHPFEPTVGQPGKDVIWVPSAQDVVEKMLDIAKITGEDYVIDLGSGDGRTVIAAAKRGARAKGIEYNPDMVELSKANASREGVSDRAHFVKADIFESDFSEATVITMFLLPELNVKLRPKLLALKPGTRIVSNTFTMGEWTCDDSSAAEGDSFMDEEDYGSYRTALLWIVPARAAGKWQMGRDQLVITQNFQMIQGTLNNGSGSIEIQNGRLRGNEIRFNAGEFEFTGFVSGERMQGMVNRGGVATPWSATLGGAGN